VTLAGIKVKESSPWPNPDEGEFKFSFSVRWGTSEKLYTGPESTISQGNEKALGTRGRARVRTSIQRFKFKGHKRGSL
jgi:hypothetical protein